MSQPIEQVCLKLLPTPARQLRELSTAMSLTRGRAVMRLIADAHAQLVAKPKRDAKVIALLEPKVPDVRVEA